MASEGLEALALFGFLAVGAVTLFSFIAVASWSDARRKERESYYRNDMLKKLADSTGAGAAAALELIREEARLATTRKRQDMKVGGLVVVATGAGLFVFLYKLVPHAPVYMVGAMLILIGLALYGSSYLLNVPTE